MKVLLLDGYNMLHRCRFNWGGGKAEGEHQITYNFMRLLKSTIDDFKPDDVYFVIDGKPVKRLEAFPAYKENRREEITDPEEIAYWESYHRQKRNCLKFLREDLPVITAYHKDYEADDVIYHLAKNKFTSDDEVIIISSDTDYIQVCSELDYVKLFNPIKREYREAPEYDYVSWKAMVGDRSDNIPGVYRIGKVKAEKILKNGELQDKLKEETFRSQYEEAYSLIKLDDMSDVNDIEYTEKLFNLDLLKEEFQTMEFQSMLEESYLSDYEDTFKTLL